MYPRLGALRFRIKRKKEGVEEWSDELRKTGDGGIFVRVVPPLSWDILPQNNHGSPFYIAFSGVVCV